MRFCFLLLISGALASAQMHDVHYQGGLTPLNITPTFDHGYLVVYDRDESVDVYASDGSLRYKASAHGPDGSHAWIRNAAVDADGTLALSVEYPLSCNVAGLGLIALRSGGIAIFDQAGVEARFIDTRCDYWPTQVAFATDHSLWAIGSLGRTKASMTADYLTLRHYSQNGEQVGAFLPRASFPHPDDPHMEPLILPMIGLWELRVANERIEVMLQRAKLWVETDLNGQDTGRWNTGNNGSRPSAFTQDGRAWRQAGKQVMVFDRSSGVWSGPVFQVAEGALIGADGNSLVFLMPDKETLRWIAAPSTTLSTMTAK
jgi:hypothetical protein